jgi:carbon monoxide dehydrogenase subunit G
MDDLSHYESRTGIVTSSSEDIYTFVTDIRNFEKFSPQGTINNWQAEKESCSFSLSMLGTVSLHITQKEKFSTVVFSGDALKKNDFTIVLHITGSGSSSAYVKVELAADLNPMLKMMAAKPIAQFLEMLIKEMENFRGWKEIRE